ncbi:MAG: hypothetical protein KKA32_16620 [Actinobacteria bacterium]|nr:hypothetical protein [Actinomycetota bacterium]
MKRTSMILMVGLIVLALLAMAAPAFAAPSPPAAAYDGLHNAHMKTHGTPGHDKVPFNCPAPHAECTGHSV